MQARDARLAGWFDEFVPRPEPVRSYARPSGRQAATDRVLLGKALGAIASYAEARAVRSPAGACGVSTRI